MKPVLLIASGCLLIALAWQTFAQNAGISGRQAARDRVRPAARTATIRGHVLAAETLAPLRRARVDFTSDAPDAPADLFPDGVTTGADGGYEIAGLPPGRYRVFAKKTGYAQADFGATRAGNMGRAVPTDSERGVTVELTDGQSFDRADIYLPKAGVITGRVSDENGDPLVGAAVAVSRGDRFGGRTRMVAFGLDTTDDRGVYRLGGLPVGTYYVSVSATGFRVGGASVTYADVLYPGVASRAQATTLSVAAGQEVAGINMTLTPIRMARVSGTILTSGRSPVADTAISFARAPGESGFSQAMVMSLRTSRDGSFGLPSVGPGEYDLTVQARTEHGPEIGSQRISVWGDDVTGVTLVTARPGVLRGTVRTDTGAALPANARTPSRVTTTVTGGASDPIVSSAGTSGTIGADGSFSMEVMPGPRVFDVTGLPADWAVARVFAGDRELTDTPLDIPAGTQLDIQVIVTNHTASLAGTIADASGRPTWDYRVIAFPKNPAKWSPELGLVKTGRPNQRGQFRVDRLRPGDYYVVAIEGSDVEWSDPAVLGSLKAIAVEVTLGAGEVQRVQMRTARLPR